MDSISRYLSSTLWSPEDEMQIREYSSSSGISRFHAEDLVEWLGLDESDETRHKQLCEFIQQSCVRSALAWWLRLREDLQSSCPHGVSTGCWICSTSNFAKTVVLVVNREATNMFHEFEKPPSHYDPDLEGKLQAVFWVLDAILKTEMAEDLVKSFARLQFVIQTIMAIPVLPVIKNLAKLVLRIYEGVVGRHLLLETPTPSCTFGDLALFTGVKLRKEYNEPIVDGSICFFNQMQLINLNLLKFDECISTTSLLSTLSKGTPRHWISMQPILKTVN